MKNLNVKTKRVLISAFLLVALLVPIVGVQAECRLNGVDNGGDVGTVLPDKIVCNASNMPVGSVEGLSDDDMIKIRTTVPGDVDGGDGNDNIFIRHTNGVIEDSLYGEYKFFTGSFGSYGSSGTGLYQGGDDILTIDGTVGIAARGDSVFASVDHIKATIIGGDDTIDLNGSVALETVGEYLMAIGDESNFRVFAGNDTIHVGGSAETLVAGDLINNDGMDSTFTNIGGADVIEITGFANDVLGDYYTFSGNQSQISLQVNGADSIVLDGTVGNDIFGDWTSINGSGNSVPLFVDGDDNIQVNEAGTVGGQVTGDYIRLSDNNNIIEQYFAGNDSIIVSGTTRDIYGEFLETNGVNNTIEQYTAGDDRIIVSGHVHDDVFGDRADIRGTDNTINQYQGGNDVIDIHGIVGFSVYGDLVSVFGDVFGNGNTVGILGGDDLITVEEDGAVGSDIYGEHYRIYADQDSIVAGDDIIIVHGTADVVYADYVNVLLLNNTVDTFTGGDDTIMVTGTTTGDFIGDYVEIAGTGAEIINVGGGNDHIVITGLVDSDVVGDEVKVAGPNSSVINFIGGDDSILITGSVGQDVAGENMGIPGFGASITNSTGGHDTIVVETGGLVEGSVIGDDLGKKIDTGGDDIIRIRGIVAGDVIGDNVNGQGGDDIIRIRGIVAGNVIGDEAGTPGNDTIRIYATAVVGGSVCADNLSGCTQDPGQVKFLDENTNPNQDGEDTIIIAGKVLGDVIAGANYGAQADDVVVIVEGAEVAGTIYAGDEDSGDTLIYIENIVNEEITIREVLDKVNELDVTNGKVTINGATYTLDDIESVAGAVGQIACFGMDYRMNKSSDGCSARSQSEKDAIQWHRDNPGADGRLPGLESCAVYSYGNALRIYEIVNGSEGELVAEIWGDVLSNAPATNELLGQTADGNISLYHLASGELQIECRNLVDGKTQVRVLSDLAGTVTNAYDKG